MQPKLYLFLITLVSFTCDVTAQKNSLNPGSIYTYQITVSGNDRFLTKESDTWRFEIPGKDDSGHYRVQCLLTDFSAAFENQSFSSDNVAAMPFRSTYELGLLAIWNDKFELRVTDSGVIVNDDDLLEKVVPKLDLWRLREDMNIKPQIIGLMRGQIGTIIKLLFPGMPDSLSAGGDPMATGQISESTVIKRLPNKTNGFSPPVNPEVFVKMSHWSDALRKGPEYDSAKVMAFFQQNDNDWRGNKDYQLHKAGLIMGTKMEKKYQLYDSLLATMPNAWLENEPMHQFNRLQSLKKQNADSAYDLIRYFKKSNSFQEWTHQTYAQAFLPADSVENLFVAEMKKEKMPQTEIDRMLKEYRQERIVSRLLLDKMLKDPDPAVRDVVYPLSLWVTAQNAKNDGARLRRLADSLEALSGKQAAAGNAQRYAILLYKELRNAGQTARAQRLLDSSIIRLEKQTGDENNKERYEAQNMLAYAYKLKYEETKTASPARALDYLAKAASYSPKENKEKAYASFYDRVFLQSEESYRADFAKALISGGDKKQAIKVLSEQLTVDPIMIGEVQKAFEQNFPGKDFHSFFAQVIVQSWPVAPQFSLQSADGNSVYKLGDYKGKWMVLDFWGTWCDPCRREMPDNNKYAVSIRESKEEAFLSIACSDNQTSVINYFQQNNFTMDAAMSDRTVEKDYGITGYPTKIIVTPDGHMLHLQFGADWKTILHQFRAIAKQKAQNPPPAKLINKKG
ncbi:MAG: redoxin domain-containing protein [Bacteroidetes bacterium]|nr:redoxin domain-containing protein [Bacteroidota bacterium]